MSQDSQLKDAVLAALKWEPAVTATHIGVTASAGVIALTGHVESYAEKFAAEAAVRRVRGVKALAEEIEVRLPFDRKRGDDDIAAAAISRLAWDVAVPRDTIRVKVEQGWVTLSGDVDWNYQREAAAADIRALSGVVGVSNQTQVKPRLDAGDVSDNIRHALHRSWFFDPKTIKVTANGGKIHLTGTVANWQDRQTAADTAWAAPGATAVENDLVIV